jgi:predicted nucleic acid-binding protein
MIAAAAAALGCTHLLSADLAAGQTLAGVRVVNPFKTSPETLA